jgi:pimeloyl-ACP methyl ester carboxylesterase
MKRKIGYGLLALLILGSGATAIAYFSFSGPHLSALESGSQIANTAVGPVEYQIIGDSGPVVLRVHGTPGGYQKADAIEGRRVLAPSRPGYLRTPIETGRTPEEQADAYAALMDSLDIKRAIVMGSSGGGPSAIAFAVRHPNRIVALIALEPISQSKALEFELPFFMHSDFLSWAVLSVMIKGMDPADTVKAMVPDPKTQQVFLNDPVKLAEVKSEMASMMWANWPTALRQVGLDNDVAQYADLNLGANTITVPTLIIHGTADVNVEYAQSVTLAAQIPGAILHSIEGAGHAMPETHSAEIKAVIEGFLSDVVTE